jgi:hypothetical protein
MDDIFIFGTNMKVVHEVKSFLLKNFDMKYLEEADVILNIKLNKNESRITLLQSHYVEKILIRFVFIHGKSSPTPYDPSEILRKNKKEPIDQLKSIIGSLMYLASVTRSDISFVVSKLSRFMSNPGIDPLRQKGLAVTNVFSYTLSIEASIADLQPLVMCTADGQSCIALGGDARIKFVLSTVLLDLTSGGRR